VCALVIGAVYLYYPRQKSSLAAYSQSFKDTCISEGSKGKYPTQAKPICTCIFENSEVLNAIEVVYDSKNIAMDKQKFDSILARVVPTCIEEQGFSDD
jgi:hypothetical protein